MGRGVQLAVFVALTGAAAPADASPNVLILLTDDMSIEKLGVYGLPFPVPRTPNIDDLAARGVRFDRAYSSPVCSPTRAQIQTGRHGYQTGITTAIGGRMYWGLQWSEITLPEMLDLKTAGLYSSAYFGKWHLGNIHTDARNHPNRQGWEHYQGSLSGFATGDAFDGMPQSYYNYEKTTNGVVARSSTYATTETVDDAIAQVTVLPEPWLTMVAFNAPHAPTHSPPVELTSGANIGATPAIRRFNQMIEAVDTEIGRLLFEMGPDLVARTTVVFMSDNGSYDYVLEPGLPVGRAKKTPYELGIHVPLIVAGPLVAVPGSSTDALVCATDLFASVAELAATPLLPSEHAYLDSISIVPYLLDPTTPSIRQLVYSEKYDKPGPPEPTRGFRTLLDGDWKLVEWLDGTEELYDMRGLLLEGPDLLAAGPLDAEQQAALDRLRLGWPS